ncbi:hypothetical protein D5085_00995 [Ectothiorhodospiraceae bacterium BW-2]|nr:hypothetical protein D5085_00995 [Ectothiorhodospiraceae bacterium BW-2]
MFTTTTSQLKIARLVLEAATPLSIGSGEYDPLYDTPLMHDANGLPTIPATALTGVLRRAVAEISGDSHCEERLFGSDETPSPLRLSFGHIHNHQNRAVDGLLLRSEIEHDPILKPLLSSTPAVRERNRLSEKGVVDDRGKFDRNITPAGHRFTLQLTLAYKPEESDQINADWQQLQQAVQSAALRIGGASRSGLGALKLHQWRELTLDLTQKTGRNLFTQLSPRLSDTFSQAKIVPPSDTSHLPQSWQQLTLVLQPISTWRTGHGGKSLTDAETRADGKTKDPDMLPLTEQIVIWQGDRATLQSHLLFPGSSIKGAIKSRFEFHYRCQLLNSELTEEEQNAHATQTMQQLFGAIEDDNGAQFATAGQLIIDDCYMAEPEKEQVQNQIHNSIDRYTQGGRHGALFTEQLVKEKLTINLIITCKLDEAAQNALNATFDDLKQGRLALGASSGRGHGYFLETETEEEGDTPHATTD